LPLKAREVAMVDFGRTACDYVLHRAGFPDRFFERLFEDRIVVERDRVLDVGTGTGTIARGLARRGVTVTGLDPSRALLDQAISLDREAGVEIRYVEATAEKTGLPGGTFDVVTAGQCWHWFERDKAAAEAYRLLVPGGRLVLAYFDWLPLPGNVVEATEKLIKEHNPPWDADGGTGVHPAYFSDLSLAGFRDIESFTFDVAVPYSQEGWLGRIRASAGVGASLSPDAVARFDAAHREMLERDFPQPMLEIPHRVFALHGHKP
jgi:SAM-dependent methyltransferase